MSNDGHHFSYSEWLKWTVEKIVVRGLAVLDPQDREDYLRVQIELAIRQAHRHGLAGLGDGDPVTP